MFETKLWERAEREVESKGLRVKSVTRVLWKYRDGECKRYSKQETLIYLN